MEISFTDNINSKMVDILNLALPQAKQARFAVAFMKHSGLSLIQENLNRCLTNGGEAEFIVGLDFRITEPEVLKKLLQLSNTGLRVKSYCFSDPSTGDTPVYHPKLYILTHNTTAVIAIGSSNLTQGGLRDNVEVNAVITADLKEEIVSDLYGLYNRIKFQQVRFAPTLEYLEKYEEAYRRVQQKNAQALRESRTRQIIRELKEKERFLPQPQPSSADLFGWQKLVYERLPVGRFRTSDMYRYEHEFQGHYPENRHIRDKIRQILQQLRGIGLLKHPRKDAWERI